MKKIVTLVLFFMMFACASNAVESEREVLRQKVLAFAFLSEYHHQLHIMIGEEEGDKLQAFTEFKEASILQTNMELIPVIEVIPNTTQQQEQVLETMCALLDDGADEEDIAMQFLPITGAVWLLTFVPASEEGEDDV